MVPWVHKCCWSNVYDSVNESWAWGRGVRCQGRPVGFVVELVSHLEPGEPGDAVRAGVSLAAFTARLPVGTCKALGSWQPWRTPDELICTFTVAGVTCNVGETGCRAVYPRHAGTTLLWLCRGQEGTAGRGWAGRTALGGRAHSGPLIPGLGVLSSSQNQRRVGCRRRAKRRPAPQPQPASPFHPFCPRAPGNPEEPGKPPLPLAPFRPNRKPEGKTHKDGTSAQPRAHRLLPAREGLQPYLPTDDDRPPPPAPCPTPVQALSDRHGLQPCLPTDGDPQPPPSSSPNALRKTRRLPFCGHCFQGWKDMRTPVISVFPLKSGNRHLYFSEKLSPKKSFDCLLTR